MSRRLRSFKRWMRSHGIECSDALELAEEAPGRGVFVAALCGLKEGDLVATIPKSACLTTRTSGARPLIEGAALGGCLALAVALMYERSLGPGSPWYGYLRLLPDRECVPLVWSASEVEELLAGTELDKTVKEDKACLYEDWKESIEPLIHTGPLKLDPHYFGLEQYFSAKTLISSRSFEIDSYHGSGMVPLADLFNHKTGAENVHFTNAALPSDSDDESADNISDASSSSRPSMEVNSNSPGGKDEALEMIVVREVDAGAEVFNTYGLVGNAALLHRYGFTELDNPFDIINIDLALVTKWSSYKFSNRRTRSRLSTWRKLNYSGCTSQDSEYFEISYNGEPQLELLVLLYIITLVESTFEKLKMMMDTLESTYDCFSSVVELIKITRSNGCKDLKIINGQKEPEDLKKLLLTESVCCALLALADSRESLYGSNSLEDDLKKLSNCCCISERKLYHSLVLRVSERKILRRLRAYATRSSKKRKL
ncbi:N-lysine methyltransferase setd6 isoform X2 [Ananas comosus]|uniref:N-lysine methyltransferase n=1 Tax=Ananas comosus TaxID=4615 RepID=A0A6P5GLM0_ANACO|nr:N-lysine methyltransferase setd6 isoform X2 [Ananas comosus]